MDVTLFMAMSANGIIASETGSEDFLSDEHWQTFSKLVHEFGCFIVGGNTYTAVKNWPWDYGFDDFKDALKVVLTDTPGFSLAQGYALATSPQEALEVLARRGFKRALLSGGAYTNSLFIKAQLIDRIILNIEPAIVGRGKALFASADFQARLRLEKTDRLPEGIVQLHYLVSSQRKE